MEPKAVNTLIDEAEHLKSVVLKEMSGAIPDKLKHLFSDTSDFFIEESLAKWRVEERFDEAIDYLIYQYCERGGENLWKQVLLDLRMKNDHERAFRLLDGLLSGRWDLYRSALKNFKKFPSNYLSAASLGISKGEVLKVLYEKAYILENRPADSLDKSKIAKVKSEIEMVVAGK